MQPAVENAIEAVAGDWLFEGAILAIRQLALTNRGFTADQVTDMVGELSSPQHLGLAFAVAQRRGFIEQVGARIGRRGCVRVWWGR